LSAGFMQDVSGSFLKKTEEKKDAQPGVAEADAFAAAAAFAKLAKHADAYAGHRHNADKMVEEKTDIEADEKHMDNEEDEAGKVTDPYTKGDKLGMKNALKKLEARVKILTKKAEKAGASTADKLAAKSGEEALKAASKQDQAT